MSEIYIKIGLNDEYPAFDKGKIAITVEYKGDVEFKESNLQKLADVAIKAMAEERRKQGWI